MNDTMIENILRKAPRPKTPAGLTERLKANIALPRVELSGARGNDWRPLVRRWAPALSFGAFLLACVVAIAVQSNVLLELRRENDALRVTTRDLEQLRQENAQYQRLAAEAQQLEQLRKDNAELQRLRAEIAQLREQTQGVAQLRAENARLLAQQKSGQAAGASEEDPFGAAKKDAQSVQCVSNLKQISLAARMWANDNKEIMPPDFLTMQNELNSPKILVCPSDQGRTRVSSWGEFGPAHLSYEFLAPGIPEREPVTTIIVRCPVHGHVGLLDGSVLRDGWKQATQRDGRWILERRN